RLLSSQPMVHASDLPARSPAATPLRPRLARGHESRRSACDEPPITGNHFQTMTDTPVKNDRTWQTLASLGAVAWCAMLIIARPNPSDVFWARMILALGPLVLVPLGLNLWQHTIHSP